MRIPGGLPIRPPGYRTPHSSVHTRMNAGSVRMKLIIKETIPFCLGRLWPGLYLQHRNRHLSARATRMARSRTLVHGGPSRFTGHPKRRRTPRARRLRRRDGCLQCDQKRREVRRSFCGTAAPSREPTGRPGQSGPGSPGRIPTISPLDHQCVR